MIRVLTGGSSAESLTVSSGAIRRKAGEPQTDTSGTQAVPVSDSAETGTGRTRGKSGEEVKEAIEEKRADDENTNLLWTLRG